MTDAHARAPRRAAAGASRGDSPSEAVEDYAKAIYALQTRTGGAVSTSALAQRLGVAPSSVTAMLKRLDGMRLARHVPYRGVLLTPSGERLALEIIRHHRLIESFLSEALGMPWDRVHAEAEVLEHYISEDLERRIAARLGDPETDPHGDPIPSVELEIEADLTTALDDLRPGQAGTFTRVSDSDPEMLRHLAGLGILPGARLEVVEVQPFGGNVVVAAGGRRHPLGRELARRMRIAEAA